jgi:hypothetical protein
MQHPDFQFVDRTGVPAEPLKLIAPVVVREFSASERDASLACPVKFI